MIPEQTIIGILTCPSDDTSRCSGKYCLGRVKDDLGFHRHQRAICSRTVAQIGGEKGVAQSERVCLTELVGRGNSEAIASRSLFAVGLLLGAFQIETGA